MFTLILLLAIGTEAIINPQGPTVVSDYANCLVQLIDAEFNRSGLLIFANTKNVSTSVINIRSELLKYIHSRSNYSIQVVSPRDEVPVCDDNYSITLHNFDKFEAIPIADYFVIVLDYYKDFKYVASTLIRSAIWNPHAKFIILLLSFSSSDKANIENVENILNCLFRYNVIQIVVIVPQTQKIRNALIYGWRPYDPPMFCGYDNETARNRLVKENVCEKGILKYKKRFFEDRLPSDMKGCVINILALERQPFVSEDDDDPNIERKFVNLMLSMFNFKPSYEIIHSFRGERDTGEWDGALSHLVSRKGNILLGGIFPDNDVHEDFECSSTYLSDSYTWVVPRADPSPPWLALMIIFKNNVWMMFITVFIICGFVWRILGQLSRDTVRNKSLFHCFLSTWICTVGFCTYLRPKTDSLRLFFVFLNLYCIMCITGYQTKLIDVLRNPTFNHQIETVEELVLSELQFGGYEELHDLFRNSSDPFDYELGEKWVVVNDISQAMIDVTVHRNFSLLCSRLELAHISAKMPELSDGFGNYKYYAFDTDVFAVPMEIVSMKGFAFTQAFSNSLSALKQIGINAAVRRYFAATNMLRRARLLSTLEKHEAVVALSLQHLQGGFLALMFGHILGTVAFILEIIISTNFVRRKISQCRNVFKRKFVFY